MSKSKIASLMLLIHTTIGELYQSLTADEIKALEAHILKNVTGKSNTLYRLHEIMRDAKAQKQMGRMDYDSVKNELFVGRVATTTKLTTYTNLLIQQIKEFLILSKMNEKNIYTEVLWGEILIERQLKRNLLIKIKNYQFDLYKDQYALLKNFYHKREKYFYFEMILAKKNFSIYINSLIDKIESFDLFIKHQRFDMLSTYFSQTKQVKNKSIFDKDVIDKELHDAMIMDNDILKVQSYILSLSLNKDFESFNKLENLFYDKYDFLSVETITHVYPTLLNYGIAMHNNGKEDYSQYYYRLLNFVVKKKDFFKQGIFTIPRFYMLLRSEIRFGEINLAEEILEKNIETIPANQRLSFENLLRSTFEFSKQNYKDSLRYISNINPSDSIYYFPLYKIVLIKCYIMLSDIERLMAERDNFGKYLTNNKKHIPEAVQMRHKLFIRYAEYLTEARYEYLTGYMKKRIETALLLSSPYFSEKEWVRERWHDLKLKFQESE